MKYCVSARQPSRVLNMADEFRVQYRDYKFIAELIEKYPNTPLIVRIPKDTEDIKWETLKAYSNKTKLTIALEDLHMSTMAKEYGLKFYWAYPVCSWYEMRGLIGLGVSQVLLGAPLYFDIEKAYKKFPHIRLIANTATDNLIPGQDGICGTYVRPEDVKVYEPYVSTFEFVCDSYEQEEETLKIYKSGSWGGNLKTLIRKLNKNIANLGLPDEFGQCRLNCGQKCTSSNNCKFCYTAVQFANNVRKMSFERDIKSDSSEA